jgi:hypothetical protein
MDPPVCGATALAMGRRSRGPASNANGGTLNTKDGIFADMIDTGRWPAVGGSGARPGVRIVEAVVTVTYAERNGPHGAVAGD